eukprot:GHVL01017298.1.p1 GENE.GHVL01017298.1~~GHVL01017298.1.p1  ORF type:complete len:262 (+),score=55.00 GHVL01017298.1:142-927(+)
MMHRILKYSFLNSIQRRQLHDHNKSVTVIQNAFECIRHSTGVTDIDEIVKIFKGVEESNYSLLTYSNDLTNEIENYQYRIRELEQQLQQQKTNEEYAEERKKELLCDLQRQIDATEEASEAKQAESDKFGEILELIRPSVLESAHFIHDFNSTDGYQDEFDFSPDSSIGQFLTFIEDNIESWSHSLGIKSLESDESPNRTAHRTLLKATSQFFPAMKLSNADDSDDETGLETPMDRECLTKKAKNSLMKGRKNVLESKKSE